MEVKMPFCKRCGIEQTIENTEFSAKHRDHLHLKCRQCCIESKQIRKDKEKKQRKQYRKRNKRTDKKSFSQKLRKKVAKRIKEALRNNPKSTTTMKLLGCSILEFTKYMEAKFQPGMAWDNHGIDGWHMDHIRPCASFDLTDPEQQKQCFHYTNLQPLWAEDNLLKSDTWDGYSPNSPAP
jgi:hypothetical protein